MCRAVVQGLRCVRRLETSTLGRVRRIEYLVSSTPRSALDEWVVQDRTREGKNSCRSHRTSAGGVSQKAFVFHNQALRRQSRFRLSSSPSSHSFSGVDIATFVDDSGQRMFCAISILDSSAALSATTSKVRAHSRQSRGFLPSAESAALLSPLGALCSSSVSQFPN